MVVAQYLTYGVLAVVRLLATASLELYTHPFLRVPLVLQHVIPFVAPFPVPGPRLHAVVVVSLVRVLMVVWLVSDEPVASWGSAWLPSKPLKELQVHHSETVENDLELEVQQPDD